MSRLLSDLISAGCPAGRDAVYVQLDETRGLKLFEFAQRTHQAYYGNALLANAGFAPAVLSPIRTLELAGNCYHYFVVEHCPLVLSAVLRAGVHEFGPHYSEFVENYSFTLQRDIQDHTGYEVLDLYPHNVGLMHDGRLVVLDSGGVRLGFS